ncbi:hypothetical protein KAF25_010471 [Fusarium avenaceum]|uniref:NACHT domain-containing protein n=1 Tax=Fusarium avenaceum TaxID=40199 RepID=A0A9P7KMN5_9HYPO|nr:hypothetical protein KAF25_010471 [Fusarium avenaceum]
MSNDSESPNEVDGPAAFWILASVALAAVAQPSTGRKKDTALFGGNIDLMRCIPAVCIVDIIFDLVIVCKTISRLFSASEPSRHTRRALPNAAVVVVRLALTTFAVLPQIIKVFSLKGVPATQMCAFIFFLATITSLMIELFGLGPETTGATSEDTDDSINRIAPMALFLQVPFECWIWHNIGYSLDIKLSTDAESLCAWSTSSCILAMAVQVLIWMMAARKPVVAEDSEAAGSLTPFTSDSFSYTISLMVIAMLVSITISKVLGCIGKLMIVCWGRMSLENEVPSTTSVECSTDQENDKEGGESSEPPPKGLLATWMGRIGVFPDRLVVHGLTLHSEVSVNISLTIFNLITTIFYYLVYFDGTDEMEVVGAVAAIVQLVGTAKDAFKYIDGVKGSAEDRQTLFQEVSILQSLVAELDSRISLNLSTGILPPPQLKGPLDQARASLQELMLLLVPPRRSSSTRWVIRDILWRMRWPIKKGSAADLLQRVVRAKDYIVFILQQEIWSSTSIIEQNTALLPAVKRQASHIERGVGNLNLEVDDKLRKDVISWMSPINFFVSQKDILTRYQSGTCESILDSPQINLWILGKGSRLLCSGIPGAGKTIFSALILQHLQQKHSASVGVRIAGVFCNYKEKDLQTPANLLAGIWRQLAYDRSPLSDEVVSLYDANAEKGTRPSFNETASVLTNEINKLSKVFVVIDAIDECGPDIVPSMLRILDIPRVNIVLTSRLPGSGPLASYASLSIQPSTLDLRLYVESRLSESSLMSRHCEKDPSLRDEVVSTITSRAGGMFLMARYHTDLVLGQDSIPRVRQTLISLPHDLNSAYAGILERIYSQEPQKSYRSRQLIAWVLFSTRPLSIEEARCALSVEPGDSSLNQDGLPDLDALLLTCSGIISINTESQCVAFVHQTIAEYLMQAPPVPIPKAHLNIARTCITYLLFDTFSGERCLTDTDLDARLSENLFFLYAAQNWGKHTKLCGEVVADLEPLIKRLLLDMGYRESSLQGLVLPSARYEGYSWTTPKHAPPLWLAAFFGLSATTYLLLCGGGFLTDTEASDGTTALSMAAKFGYTDVMTIVLNRGAELGGSQGAAIPHLEAARYGQTDAVSILLEYGADINGKSSNGRTALHEAVSGGHDTTLTLLNNGADVNAMTINRWTVLHSAVAARQEEFVVQLLHHGATVNTQTSEGETVLHIAASRGFDSIISRLLDAGALSS